MKTITTEELIKKLHQGYYQIDVRAPSEFIQGSLPNSVNLPILDDTERALVGLTYKTEGREAAIILGHKIVSGDNKKQKLNVWTEFIEKNPKTVLTCFRGGLRSLKAQEFLSEMSIDIPRIEGGYKEVRTYFMDQLKNYSHKAKLRLLTGSTGSGKTNFLKEVSSFYPVVDLEDLANHRGSAFGVMKTAQPAQATFENNLSYQILKLKNSNTQKPFLFEDESRLIGSIHLPEGLFEKIRINSVIKMNVDLSDRINNIYQDYIYKDLEIFEKYEKAIQKITKRLGGLRAQELLIDLRNSKKHFLENQELQSNKIWIEKLLIWYYDPMYNYSFEKRNPVIEFQGSREEVLKYLSG